MIFKSGVPTEKALLVTLDRMASTISTYRNAETAIYDMWLMDRYVSKRGIIIADDFTPMEILGKAAGFQPRRFTEQFGFLQDERKLNEVLEEKAADLIKNSELWFKYSESDPEQAQAYWDYVNTQIQAMGEVNPSHRQRVLQMVADRLSDPETAWERTLADAIRRASESMSNDLHEGRMLRRLRTIQENQETQDGN